MNCVNIKSQEFQELLETTKLPSLLLEMRIAKWQEQNGLDRFPTSNEVLVRTDVVELFESNPELANEVYEALWGNSSISKIIEEEISIYNRFRGSNYFKDNPSDMFSPNFMRESVEEINPNEVILTEQGQSEERLREMGEYKIPEYGEYSTEYPIAFKYNDKIYLLDGHHRITLAKRSNIDKVKIAVKNIKFDFVNKLSPQQKTTAQQLYSSYLETTNNPTIEGFKQWNNKQQVIDRSRDNISEKSILKPDEIKKDLSHWEDIYEEIFNWSQEDTNSREVLKNIKKFVNTNSEVYNLINRIDYLSFKTVFEEKFPKDLGKAYMYISNGDTIHLNLSLISKYNVDTFIISYLHEVIHGYTLKEYYSNKEFKKEIDSLYKKAKSLSKNKGLYGYTEALEFIAEIMTNPKFIEDVKSLKENIFQRFINLIKDFIYGKKDSIYKQSTDLIDRIIDSQNEKYLNESIDNYLDRISDYGIVLSSKPRVSELFEANPELANIGTPEQYSQYLEQNPNGSVEGFKSWVGNNQPNIQYQKQIDLQVEQDTVLEEFANNLSERFNIPFDLVSEEDARAMFPEYTNEPAFFDPKTKKAYLVKGKANKTSAIHEIFTHPFLLQIEKTNPTLYKNLLKEAKDNKSVVDYVDNLYGKDQNNDHEYIARAIDLAVQGELDQQKDKTLLERIQDFFNQLSDYLKKLFNIPEVFSSAISPNITLQQLTQFAMYGKGKMNLNPAQENIEYSLKATNVIVKNLANIKQWEKNKSINEDVLWNKIQKLGVPKEQLELVKNSEGNTAEEKLLEFANRMSFAVEINTAKENKVNQTGSINKEEWDKRVQELANQGLSIEERRNILEKEFNTSSIPTQYYSNLSVPGGTNYIENAHVIPTMKGKVLPDIYPHHDQEFAYGDLNMYGWDRSDEQVDNGKLEKKLEQNNEGKYREITVTKGTATKIRRILEIQSKFQKWRLNFEHKDNKYQILENQTTDKPNIFEDHYLENGKRITDKEYNKIFKEFLDTPTSQEDAFIKLIAKQWETLMIRSIIQDSAKKGYEKVLFPLGNTASKIESHTTLEEFKKEKQNRLNLLENNRPKIVPSDPHYKTGKIGFSIERSDGSGRQGFYDTKEQAEKGLSSFENKRVREIEQLKQELESIEREGFGALRPIYNFYENTVTNILKKQFKGQLKEITDEYGNKWNEVTIDENRDNQNIVFQKTPQSNSFQQFQQSLNKPNTNPVLQGNQKPDVILPIGTSGSGKSTFIKSLPQENLIVIEPDAMRVEFTGDMNDKSKDKEIYEEAAKRAVTAIGQGKQVVFDTTNLTKEKRLPFIEAIKKEIPNANIQYKLMELNPELAKQRIKADIAAGKNRANVPDATIDRHAESYKQMLEDIKNEPISNFDVQQEQVKKFAELQERLNNKEFLEGAKNTFESSEELQNVYYEAIGFGQESDFKQTFKSSLWRGQEYQPFIDENGNLVLTPTYDSLFKSEGISFAENLSMAKEYGERYSKNPFIIEIDESYADSIYPLDRKGRSEDYGKRVVGDEREQRFVTKDDIVIPKGKFKIHKQKLNLNLSDVKTSVLLRKYQEQFTESDIAEHLRYGEIAKGYSTEDPLVFEQVGQELLKRGITKKDLPFLIQNRLNSLEYNVAEALGITKEFTDNFTGKKINLPDESSVTQKDIDFYLSKVEEVKNKLENKGTKNEISSENNTQPTPQQKQDALNAYTDHLARVSLGIIKNPSSGGYNYESKVKDIVYRGEGNNDSNKYLYFTNNKKEAYLYSKNHITKGGNINERNPTISINKNFSKYLESKYSKILIKSLYHEPLGPGDFFEGFIENPKSKLSEEDLILFNKIERFNILYDYVKIEDENDLTKPYDDDYYINNIDEYNSLRKELDNYYNKKDIGNLISAIINITNPYIDEITQEDLINNRLAFKNGKDGAFLLGGDHFLVKKDQIHILGSKDDIEGFRNWVGNSQSSGSLHIDFSFFQKSPSEQEEYLTNMFESLQEEEEVTESVEVEDVIDSIFQGSLSEVIDNMIHHMDLSDNTSEILLKILSKTNAEIEYVSASELTSTDTIMEYDHGRNVIKVSLERLNEYSPAEISITLLHEMVHSITVESLRNPKTFEQKDLVDLIESFINDNKDLSEEWGMSSTFEFVAELYSNPEFRDKVKEASKTKWWSDFINAIRRLLGLPYKRNYNNLVERVIEFVDNAESSETTFNQIFERKSTEKESKYANLTSYLNIVYEEIQDKVGQVADRIRTSQKFKSQEDKKEYLENIEKLIEFLEEHHETGQWLGVLEYTKLFLKTTQQVNNLLEKITPQDIENGDLGALLHRYEEYLAAYDLLEDMKGLLDFANRKSDELSEKELEDVKEIGDFLRSARIVKEGIDSKILHIKKRQLIKFYSNPLYNTQVTTNWRILLSNEYRDLPKEEREKISEAEYISQKLNGEYKQDYEADLKNSAEKLVYDPLIDISWTARHLYDPFNTNQPIIQILTNFIGEIRQRIVERSREKSFTIDELHKKLIKEKGNRKPSALFKNLYQQDKDGNYFLKGEYDITFYDAYREEYLPILQSIQEIYKLFGNKFSEETTAELNKLRIKKSTWEKKYLKEDKLTPKDEFKTDLSALSPAERQILEEFINISKGSHDKTEGRVSLIRNASFKRGKKRNNIEFLKLPAINKTDIERRIETDAKGIIKDKTEDLFTIRTDDVGYAKEAITAKGRPVAEIPIYFRGNLDPSQQSLDLASMYKMEFWNGEQFKESTQGKYTAHMILDVVGSNDFLKKSRGVPRLLQNAFAKRQPNQKVEGTSTNTYHRIQGLIERNFGGITTYYAGKFLGKDVNKMISNVQAMTGVLGMSFNAAAGVANLFNGFSNLIMEAVGNNIVGRKHLMKAESKYMLALANGEILSDLTNPVKKSFINQLNEYFDVFGGLMPEQQSSLRNNFMRKFASLGMLNWMNDSGEHMLHSILNMAILDSIKVMNKDGKYINKQGEVVSEENAASLLDMFYLDKNGHLAVHEAVGKTKYNLTIDFQEGGKVHIKNLIKKKIFDIYGVYDTNFKNELSKLWGGKLLMTFKNFFLSLFNYRFAGIEYSHLPLEEREDWQKFYSTADQEYIEGIYTTFVHTVVIPIFKGFKIALIKENYNKLTDYQKSNLRKALFEFAMTNVLLPAIGLLLAAIDGDDDDKLWFAIYINRRLTAELAQFRNPVEATKLLTNPIASAKFVRDAIGLSLEIIRPWRWDERAGDGELRIRKRFKRVVPIWNQLEKNYRQLYNIQFNN